MKRVIIAVCILLILPLMIFTTHFYLKKTTSDMSSILNNAQICISKHDTKKAEKLTGEFNDEWDHHSKIMATFIRHSEMDEVNLSTAKLTSYLKYDEPGEFSATCDEIKKQLDHLWESEKFTIDNIF